MCFSRKTLVAISRRIAAKGPGTIGSSGQTKSSMKQYGPRPCEPAHPFLSNSKITLLSGSRMQGTNSPRARFDRQGPHAPKRARSRASKAACHSRCRAGRKPLFSKATKASLAATSSSWHLGSADRKKRSKPSEKRITFWGNGSSERIIGFHRHRQARDGAGKHRGGDCDATVRRPARAFEILAQLGPTRPHGRPPLWRWEFQRRPKELGIKVYGTNFKTESAAKLAGERALVALLDRLAKEERNA